VTATNDRKGHKDAHNKSGGSRAAKSWRVEGRAPLENEGPCGLSTRSESGKGVQRACPLARGWAEARPREKRWPVQDGDPCRVQGGALAAGGRGSQQLRISTAPVFLHRVRNTVSTPGCPCVSYRGFSDDPGALTRGKSVGEIRRDGNNLRLEFRDYFLQFYLHSQPKRAKLGFSKSHVQLRMETDSQSFLPPT